MKAVARKTAKRLLTKFAPQFTVTVQSIRSRRQSHRLFREWGLTRIDDRVVATLGLTVTDGPFHGMHIPAAARSEHLAPYLLGTYESELHGWLAEVRTLQFQTVLDVGAKFGYYAVGLARWFPQARVLAWDTDPWARRAMRVGSGVNGLGNVGIRGYLRPGCLATYVRGATLVISDCEGFEQELLGSVDPTVLSSAWMIVEMHEDLAPGVGEFLRRRFAGTHTAEVVARMPRTPPEWVVGLLGEEDAVRAVSEIRGDQTWVLFRPLRGAAECNVPSPTSAVAES